MDDSTLTSVFTQISAIAAIGSFLQSVEILSRLPTFCSRGWRQPKLNTSMSQYGNRHISQTVQTTVAMALLLGTRSVAAVYIIFGHTPGCLSVVCTGALLAT